MANARTGNTIYIDATGAVTTNSVKVTYILFTPDAANDELLIRETSSGGNRIYLRGATAKETLQFDFSACPIVLTNGLYIQTITSGAKAILVTASGGN